MCLNNDFQTLFQQMYMELLVAKKRLPTNTNTQTYAQTPFARRDSLLITWDKLWIMFPLRACASARRSLWLKCWDRILGVVSKAKNICQWWHSDWRSLSIFRRTYLTQIAAQTIKAQYFCGWPSRFVFLQSSVTILFHPRVDNVGCRRPSQLRWDNHTQELVSTLSQGHIETQLRFTFTHTYCESIVHSLPLVFLGCKKKLDYQEKPGTAQKALELNLQLPYREPTDWRATGVNEMPL